MARPPCAVISLMTCSAGEEAAPSPWILLPRSFTTILAPWLAKNRACALPKPLPEPVTIATRPSSRRPAPALEFWITKAPLLPAENHCRRNRCAADAVRYGDFGIGNLAIAGFAAKLTNCFDQQEQAKRSGMAVRQAATRGHRRECSPRAQISRLNKGSSFTFGTETQVFQMDDGVDGEGIVRLEHINVFRRNSCHFEGRAPRGDCACGRKIFGLCDVPEAMALSCSKNANRLFRGVLPPVFMSQDRPPASICNQAAIKFV